MLLRSQTGGDTAIPFSTMTSAIRLKDGRWEVTASDGGLHYFNADEWKLAIESTPVATFPALPGTYVLSRNTEPEPQSDPAYWRSNILGWMISIDGELRPVTLDPAMNLFSPWTILHPDGRVETSSGETWDTVDEWLGKFQAGS